MERTENERMKTFFDFLCQKSETSLGRLAREMNRSRDTLVKWQTTSRVPAEAVSFFSRKYGLQVNWFFHGDGPMVVDSFDTAWDERGEPLGMCDQRMGFRQPRPDNTRHGVAGNAIPVIAVIGDEPSGRSADKPPVEAGRFMSLFRPALPGEVAFGVMGDAMEPAVYHGDIITCRPIPPVEMHDAQDYVVVTERGPQLRHVSRDSTTGKVLLHSRNPEREDTYRPATVYTCYEIVAHIHPYRTPS